MRMEVSSSMRGQPMWSMQVVDLIKIPLMEMVKVQKEGIHELFLWMEH